MSAHLVAPEGARLPARQVDDSPPRMPTDDPGPAKRRRAARAFVAAALLAVGLAAHAGTPCTETPPSPDAMTRAMVLAEHVQRELDASGAQVVLLARAGQDLRKYNLQYSHLAFAYKETLPTAPAPIPIPIPTPVSPLVAMGDPIAIAAAAAAEPPPAPPVPPPPRTVWRIAHKLNQCGTDRAAVYRQGLGEFFLDSPFEYRAAFVVPDPEVQAALMPVLTNDRRLVRWNTPRYSVVAYPWATTYQQSNQWALETLAGALDPAAVDRERAQAWLRLHDYQPTVLHLDAFTRLGARMTRANVAFDDHPNDQRFSDRIATVTVDSMFAWLQRSHLSGPPTTVY